MSFLRHYRDYVAQTEAHPTYHTYSALVALAAIIGRRVWVPMGDWDIFPNLYVILVGPSGNRKTSAMTPAKDLLRELGLPFSAECVTKEKLVLDVKAAECSIKDMPEEYAAYRVYSPMTCMVTELSEFLGAGGLGMINFLVTIYDQKYYDIRTKNKGDSMIVGPYVSVLACTTPDWITIYLRQDIISGGFSRRAIFVFESDKGTRIPRPMKTPQTIQAWRDLVVYAKTLSSVKGPFKWEPEATEFFDHWYMNLKTPTDPMTAGYYESKHVQLLKIAMLFALSESRDLVLTKRHLEHSLEMLALAETNMPRVFAGMGRNELNGVAGKIMECLRTTGEIELRVGDLTHRIKGMPEKQLRGMFFQQASNLEIDQILKHLTEVNKIEILVQTNPSAKTPAQRYVRVVE